MSWKHRVAIVTGAASGIGQTICEHFAEVGVHLVVGDLAEEALSELVGRLPEGTQAVASDLSKEEGADELVNKAVAEYGRIDILVNNAGGGVIRPFLDHTPESLRETLDRNLWTTLWCTRAALPHMLSRKYGRVVSVGADSVRNGLWQHAGYNAAKGGVHGLTTGLAREFAAHDLTFNSVAPCIVDTPNVVEMRKNQHIPLLEDAIGVVPKGRPATTAEVASMVRYLASEEAAFITGQVISVNGGSTML